ncbi:hypothetical protein ANN_01501 [Periplaneta americana]|uniref:Uncharacterized protein n=1 Tax=Periplaneta americana TaxID=6978 RepID=A0ABQ8TX48_PERAM|nr:hypothetical protein ANN_01501 [Periplaneta americana]
MSQDRLTALAILSTEKCMMSKMEGFNIRAEENKQLISNDLIGRSQAASGLEISSAILQHLPYQSIFQEIFYPAIIQFSSQVFFNENRSNNIILKNSSRHIILLRKLLARAANYDGSGGGGGGGGGGVGGGSGSGGGGGGDDDDDDVDDDDDDDEEEEEKEEEEEIEQDVMSQSYFLSTYMFCC